MKQPSMECRIASLLCVAGLLTACGGSSESMQDFAAAPPPPSPANSAAAMALFNATRTFGSLARLPAFDLVGGKAPALAGTGRCDGPVGYREASLDGAAAPARTPLPIGDHTFVVRFVDCTLAATNGAELVGTVSLAYETPDWRELTAHTDTQSLRAANLYDDESLGFDVTASGSGLWNYSGNDSGDQTTFTPGAGATMVNNLTTNVITFKSGSIVDSSKAGTPWVERQGFTNLELELNGVSHVLDGILERTWVNGRPAGWTGEIRITRGGTLVARIYPVDNSLRAEAYAPLVEF